MIYAQVWTNNANGQKMVTIPKGSIIKQGDWVKIQLMPDDLMEEVEK